MCQNQNSNTSSVLSEPVLTFFFFGRAQKINKDVRNIWDSMILFKVPQQAVVMVTYTACLFVSTSMCTDFVG